MQIHEIKVKKRKLTKTIGRGGKRGTYSGRGNKGQKARSGANIDPLFEGGRSSLVERMKKIRGFKSIHQKNANVNLADLDKFFNDGDKINTEGLLKYGILGKVGKACAVKILGDGKLTKKIIVEKGILVSASAKNSIEKAGGKVNS